MGHQGDGKSKIMLLASSFIVGFGTFGTLISVGFLSKSQEMSIFSIIWAVVFTFGGLSNGLYSLMASGKTDDNGGKRVIPNPRELFVFNALNSIVAGILFLTVFNLVISESERIAVTVSASLAVFMMTGTNQIFALLNRDFRFRSYSIFAIVDTLVRLAILTFVAFISAKPTSMSIALAISGTLSVLIGYFIFKPNFRLESIFGESTNLGRTRKLFLSFIGNATLVPLLVGVPFLITIGKTQSEIRVLVALIISISLLRSPFLLPAGFMRAYFATKFGRLGAQESRKYLLKLVLTIFAISLPAAFLIFQVGNFLLGVVFPKTIFEISPVVLALVVIGAAAQAAANIAIESLLIQGRQVIYTILAVSNLLLIVISLLMSADQVSIALSLLWPPALCTLGILTSSNRKLNQAF